MLNQQKMAEAQRVQQGLFGEATRQQQIDAQGKMFMYREKDNRYLEQLDRKQAQLTGQQQLEAQRKSDAANIMGAGLQAGAAIIGQGIASTDFAGFTPQVSSVQSNTGGGLTPQSYAPIQPSAPTGSYTGLKRL